MCQQAQQLNAALNIASSAITPPIMAEPVAVKQHHDIRKRGRSMIILHVINNV
jgi:hypothetical protein